LDFRTLSQNHSLKGGVFAGSARGYVLRYLTFGGKHGKFPLWQTASAREST